jgi:BlaI family transcriptional regulator, penicillinase repressor
MPTPPKPTDSELSILRVLWSRGPSTVRQVHDELVHERDLGYTTVLKVLLVMLEKGLVVRNEAERSHVYFAAVPEGDTKRALVSDLMDKAFGGSASQLLQHALQGERATAEELRAIQRLLDEATRRRS